MAELAATLWQLVTVLGTLVLELLRLALANALLLAWLAWWLAGANWKKIWPALGAGAWTGLLLLWGLSALVWSRLEQKPCDCLGVFSVPNLWWQLGAVGLLIASAFFCGWLQHVLHWTPPEIELEPPLAAAHDAHEPFGHHPAEDKPDAAHHH